jgi:hypothetical protein
MSTKSNNIKHELASTKESVSIFIENYLASMTPKERKGYEIAKSHLGSSFQIEKSIGFREFIKNSEQNSSISVSSP